jgi:hypothetical protein
MFNFASEKPSVQTPSHPKKPKTKNQKPFGWFG